MPTNKNRRRSTPAGSSSRATLRYAEREILKGQTDYPTYIKHITASAMLLADRLSKSGDVETSLADSSNTTNSSSDHHPTTMLDESSQSFLLEQRERLKELCKQNVMSHRDTEAYVAALTGVRDDIQELQRQRKVVEDEKAKKAAENNNANDDADDDDNGHHDDNDDDEEPPDYEKILLEKVAEYKQKRVNDGLELDLDDEELVRKCCDRLGEKPRTNKRKGRGGGGEEEDDELEVMNPQTGTGQQQQSSASLIDTPFRCPITGLFFSKPVKSKVCNHIYDLDGLRQILGNNNAGKANCPIPGCTNRNLTLAQVEDDVEMMMKVRRHKNRCEQEQIQRMSQDQDYDDNDDGDGAGRDMGDGTTARMTVLD